MVEAIRNRDEGVDEITRHKNECCSLNATGRPARQGHVVGKGSATASAECEARLRGQREYRPYNVIGH